VSETWIVAHDFSPCSDAAADEAARLLAPVKGTMRLFHVHQPVKVEPHLAWGEETYALEKNVRQRLQKTATALKAKHPGVEVECDVGSSGEPAKGILTEADRIGVDHIVVGTHSRQGVARFILGSVAERVVREAKVPVLVVKGAV
jgi:nucleotide-binding universal stress UspA family protein